MPIEPSEVKYDGVYINDRIGEKVRVVGVYFPPSRESLVDWIYEGKDEVSVHRWGINKFASNHSPNTES